MGTNYYAHFNACKTCGHCKKVSHIGKKSYGWKFMFLGYKPELICADQWHEILSMDGVVIKDEFDEEIRLQDFWEMVDTAQKDEKCRIMYNINNKFPSTESERNYIQMLKSCGFTSDRYGSFWIDTKGYNFIEGDF